MFKWLKINDKTSKFCLELWGSNCQMDPNGAFNPGSSRIKVTYSTTNSRSLHGKKGHSRKGHFEESG